MKKRFLGGGIVLLLLLGGSSIVFHYTTLPNEDVSKWLTPRYSKKSPGSNSSASRENTVLGDKVASIKNQMQAHGIPVYADEIIKPPHDDLTNGATYLKSALKIVEEQDENSPYWQLISNFKKLTPDEIRDLLQNEAVREILDLALKASDMDIIDLEIDYSKGAMTELPELGGMRSIIRLMSLKISNDLKSEDYESAQKYLNGALKFNAKSSDNLTMISGLVEVSNHKIIDANIQEMINAQAGLEGTYKILENELNVALDDQLKSLDGERMLFGGWMFEMVLLNPEKSTEEVIAALGADAEMYREMSMEDLNKEYSAYLEKMMEMRLAMEEPYYVNNEKFQSIKVDEEEYPILATILPAFGGIYKRYNEHQSSLKKNLLSIKLSEFKAKNGSFPESLADLNLPVDYLRDNISGNDFTLFEEDGKTYLGNPEDKKGAVGL